MFSGLLLASMATLSVASSPGRSLVSHDPVRVLAQGRALCAQGKYADGIDVIFRAAVLGQKLSSRQRRRLAWRPAAKRCFLSWIGKLSVCRPEPEVAATLTTLESVAAKAVKVAMPAVVRKAETTRKRCLARLAKLLEKHCRDEPGIDSAKTVGRVAKALGAAAKPIQTGLNKARDSCIERWRANLELRCKVHPDMATAKEAAALVPAAPKVSRSQAKKTYETCIRAMADRGLAMCRSGKYLEGRRLVEEALGRFGFYGATNQRFVDKTTADMKAQCGRFLVRLKGSVVAKLGTVRMKLALTGGFVLTGTRRLTGTFLLESKPVWANAGKATVQVRTQTCRARLGGTYNPKTHNLAWWPKEKPTCSESIQVTSPNGTARVIRETLVSDMARAARLLKSWMPGTDGSRLGLDMSGPIGGGRTVRLKGNYRLKVLHD